VFGKTEILYFILHNSLFTLLLPSFQISRGIRLIGVRVSNLVTENQMCFLQEEKQSAFITRAMDLVNDQFGECTVTWASVLNKEGKQKVIAPGTRNQTLSPYRYDD